MTSYRALISVPISADSDERAQDVASGLASRLHNPGGSIAGHVELVTEVDPRAHLRGIRVVMEAPGFREQVPLAELPEIG